MYILLKVSIKNTEYNLSYFHSIINCFVNNFKHKKNVTNINSLVKKSTLILEIITIRLHRKQITQLQLKFLVPYFGNQIFIFLLNIFPIYLLIILLYISNLHILRTEFT